MAKDDYYVIVYKILAYLYARLKEDEKIDVRLIVHDSSMLDIKKGYWTYIIEHMWKQGFIEGIDVAYGIGDYPEIVGLEYMKITPDGIGYLLDNNLLAKAKKLLKEMKEINPFV